MEIWGDMLLCFFCYYYSNTLELVADVWNRPVLGGRRGKYWGWLGVFFYDMDKTLYNYLLGKRERKRQIRKLAKDHNNAKDHFRSLA